MYHSDTGAAPRGRWMAFRQALRYRYGYHTMGSEPELHFLQRFCARGAIALDIGANFGLYTYSLSRLVGPQGRVVAFEPYGPTYHLLDGAVRTLRCRNVKVLEVALSDFEGSAGLVVPQGDARAFHGCVHLAPKAAQADTPEEHSGGAARATTLDRWAERAEVGCVDFVKIDVEGQELAVLAGGARLLASSRPVLLVEIQDMWCRRYGHTATDVERHVRMALPDYVIACLEAGKVVDVGGVREGIVNYFLIPEERWQA